MGIGFNKVIKAMAKMTWLKQVIIFLLIGHHYIYVIFVTYIV